jgi:2-amino-4-hydroxy-6-hydroxymethyldihydropteridine diphosphokinase
MKPNALVIIALGANVGTPSRTLLLAMERIQEFSDRPLAKSSLWCTSPVDCPPGSPEFVNAVVALVPRSNETPESLFAKLQTLEKEFGRRQKEVINEPRPLDLDLIAFGDSVRETAELTVPHPRAARRRFVLQPLSELAPELVLPGHSATVSELLDQLPADPGMRRCEPT